MVIFLLSPLRARKSDNYSIAIVGKVITLERELSKKKQRTNTNRMQRGLRVITLQGA